jgi:hypothetical protein
MTSGDFFMKGKPLGEAEKAQNTKIACHVETRRQDCGRSGSRAKFSFVPGSMFGVALSIPASGEGGAL